MIYQDKESYLADVFDKDIIKKLTQPLKVLPLLKDAIRWYPIFAENGKIYKAGYAVEGGWMMHQETYLKEVTIEGFRAYQADTRGYFLGVGPNEVPQDVPIDMRGVPMFHSVPYGVLE